MKTKSLVILVMLLALMHTANTQQYYTITTGVDMCFGECDGSEEVIGGGTYAEGSEIDLIAIHNEKVYPSDWMRLTDHRCVPLNSTSDTLHITVTCDAEYLVTLQAKESCTRTVVSADENMGAVVGDDTVLWYRDNNEYNSLEPGVIQAIPNPGYDFLFWNSDGLTFMENPLTVRCGNFTAYFQQSAAHDTTVIEYIHDTIYLHDTVYLPIYIHDTIYITQDGVDAVKDFETKIYSNRGQIVVDGADGNTVTLLDVNGRILAVKKDEYTLLRFDVPYSGTYLVKIGQYSTHKIVVIK